MLWWLVSTLGLVLDKKEDLVLVVVLAMYCRRIFIA